MADRWRACLCLGARGLLRRRAAGGVTQADDPLNAPTSPVEAQPLNGPTALRRSDRDRACPGRADRAADARRRPERRRDIVAQRRRTRGHRIGRQRHHPAGEGRPFDSGWRARRRAGGNRRGRRAFDRSAFRSGCAGNGPRRPLGGQARYSLLDRHLDRNTRRVSPVFPGRKLCRSDCRFRRIQGKEVDRGTRSAE